MAEENTEGTGSKTYTRSDGIGGGPAKASATPQTTAITRARAPRGGMKGGGISADLIGGIVNRLPSKALTLIVWFFGAQIILGALGLDISGLYRDWIDYKLEIINSQERQNDEISNLRTQLLILQVTNGDLNSLNALNTPTEVPAEVPTEAPQQQEEPTVVPTIELPSPTETPTQTEEVAPTEEEAAG